MVYSLPPMALAPRIIAFEKRHELFFVRIFVPWCIGNLLFDQMDMDIFTGIPLLSGVVAILVFALLVINYGYRHLNAYRFKPFTGILISLCCFCAGALAVVSAKQAVHTVYSSKQGTYYTLIIDDEPQFRGKTIRFRAKLKSGYEQVNDTSKKWQAKPVSGNLMVTLYTLLNSNQTFQYGDELVIPGKIKPVPPPENPASFDFRYWLATQRIYNQAFLNTAGVLKLDSNQGNPVLAFSLKIRQKQLATYRNLIRDDNAFAVASTLILGYRADLNPETLNVYSATGTIHAFSVSGMHVGLIYLVFNWLLKFMDHKKLLMTIKLIVLSILIWAYVLITGCSAAALRSVIMLSVLLLAKFLNRNSNPYNVLAFTAFTLLLYDPLLIRDIGFQLSFLAVVGLIYLQPKLEAVSPVNNRWFKQFWSAMAMSVSAQLFTYPLSLYYFHQFPLCFLLSNFFILLPVTLMMYLGILILLIPVGWLGKILEQLILFTNTGLGYIANLPYANIRGIWITKKELILLSLALAFLLLACIHRHKCLLFAGLSSILLLRLYSSTDQLKKYNQQKAIVFKIRGQQATIFLRSNTAIIFTGLKPQDKVFQQHIQPALDQHQIRKIICFPLPEIPKPIHRARVTEPSIKK